MNRVFLIFCLGLLIQLSSAWAKSQNSCGLLMRFDGDIQILDSTRDNLLKLNIKTVLPCGSWISINQGWAQIKHANGAKVHLGNHTLIQLVDSDASPQLESDDLVLYQGETYIEASDIDEELSVVTASGRARAKHARFLLLFDPRSDETQIVTLANAITFENRFEPTRRVRVGAGEVSSLNFKLLRVLPAAPSAFSVTELRPRLTEMHVSPNEEAQALRAVENRKNRKFASILNGSRSIASEKDTKLYLRHNSNLSEKDVEKKMIRKLAGEEDGGEKILRSEKGIGKKQKAQDEENDSIENQHYKLQRQEEIEKQRLIHELSQIHSE